MTALEDERRVSTSHPDELVLPDLFNDVDDLIGFLEVAVERGQWVDAFLLAAGISQILEDHATPTRTTIRRGIAYLVGRTTLPRGLASIIEHGGRLLSTTPQTGRRRSPAQVAARARPDLELIAAAVVQPAVESSHSRLESAGRSLADAFRSVADAVGSDVVRMPSCFRSFDQRPEDCLELASMVSARSPDRNRPMTVVGVRTSGSYLAPLLAASLRSIGYRDVAHATVRPGWPMSNEDVKEVRRTARSGGTVVVIDDPPTTGKSIAAVAAYLGDLIGNERRSIIVALALFNDPLPSPALDEFDVVSLPFTGWAIHRVLTADAARATLTRLLDGRAAVQHIERSRAIDAERPARGHVRVSFDITVVDRPSGVERTEIVVAEGCGLGYFGRHLLAVSSAAPHLFPKVLGVVDGICYRSALPTDRRLDGPERSPADIGRQIANHLATRRAALPAVTDRSIDLAGRQPAWEIAARIVSRTFGRYALAFRPTVVDPLLRRVLVSATPSITDGSPSRSAWFAGHAGSPAAIKVDFAEGPFGHFDLASYDALSDVAAAAVSFDTPDVTSSLRSEYERLTGVAIDPARWMLYQLVSIWDAERRGDRAPYESRRSSARVLQAFFAEVYLQGLPVATGPFVALDLDGCLESSTLGFPATTQAGAMTLRALRAHGYRILLASGRSRDEIAERCQTYGLAGGVAEYGAYVVPPAPHRPVALLRSDSFGQLETLRDEVARRGGLEVDPDFTGVVRVRSVDPSRRSSGIGVAAGLKIVQAAGISEESIRVIDGEDQTDLAPIEADKGRSLRFLLDHYFEGAGRPLACAVGDSVSDWSMFAVAEQAYAPGNATLGSDVAGVRVTRKRYQLGCVAAASEVIGHAVGSCPACAAPVLSSATETVITLLSVQEGGPSHSLGTIAKLCRSVASSADR